MPHESVVEQQMKSTPNLPIEVIVVPQYDDSKLVNNTNYNLSNPINIKIRLRNKDEKGEKYGIISAPKLCTSNGKKLRLISSDQTIMSFDLFVEPNTSKKFQKKAHKNFLHFFKPGGCLRMKNENDDNTSYLPNAYNDKIRSTSSVVDIDIISEKNVLKKTISRITSTERTENSPKAFMGKCKPGGCLDPPFNEDRYSYEPTLKISLTSLKHINNGKKPLIPETSSLNRESDIKLQVNEKSRIEKPQLENNFNEEHHAHSLITYPTSSSNHDYQVHKENDIKFKSRLSKENKARLSINEFSEIYFMPPKKDKTKIEEKNFTEKKLTVKDKIDFGIKKSSSSLLKQEQIKWPIVTMESKSFLNNNTVEPTKIIENSNSMNEVNNVCSMNADVNSISDTHFNDLVNINMTNELTLNKNVYSSQNVIFDKNSTTNQPPTEGQVKNNDNLPEKCKEPNENEIGEINYMDDIRSSSLKNVRIPNSNSKTIMIPVNKTNELLPLYSLVESIETLKNEHIEITDKEKITVPSLKNNKLKNADLICSSDNYVTTPTINSKEQQEGSLTKEFEEVTDINKTRILNRDEMQNKDLDNTVNYPVLKDYEDSVKESQESFEKKVEDNTNTAEIKATLINSKDESNLSINNIINNEITVTKELQYIHKESQDSLLRNPVDISDINEVNKTWITSAHNLVANNNSGNMFAEEMTKALFQTLNDKDTNLHIFQSSEKTISEDYQTSNSFDKISHVVSGEKQISNNTLRQEIAYLAKEHDDKNITDTHFRSSNTNSNKYETTSSTELFRQSSEFNSIRKHKSSVFLLGDETDKKYLSFTREEGIDDDVDKFKDLISSESVRGAIDSNKNTIDRGKSLDGNHESINSINFKKIEPLEDQPLKILVESFSKILNNNDDINNKHKADYNVTKSDKEDYAKSIDLTNLENLQSRFFNINQSDDRKQKKIGLYEKVKPYNENFRSTYSSIAIDFGFHYSVDSENRLIIKTVDTTIPLNNGKHDDDISIIKSIIRANGDEIRIPINFDTDLALQIKEATHNTSEATTSQIQHEFEKNLTESLSNRAIEKDDILQETLNSVYKNLIPLNMIIQNLKEEANTLSRQQSSIQEILERMDMKPKRLIHTKTRCGCEKKYP